ncbi:DUF1015 domain-containing protein [Modestobacter sp. NPDC049651]|uniref:DUF1015 domain-containing protein n=1 Tax=unclassified Modestobacter TaxID=2643866 RepID=UPI003402F508
MPSTSADDPPLDPAGLDVRPFRALTYREHDPDQLARVSSPAYDLVTAAGRDRLAAADPHNIVRLILPHVERTPGDPAPGEGSARTAAATLARWLSEGVLARDPAPALWRYDMARPGVPATSGWLAAVGLPRPGSTAVLPHEDTYAPAVEGRRALLDATATDLEPIVLAHDPDPVVRAETERAGTGVPALEVADPDGVVHRLWRVTDPATLTRVTAAFAGTGAVIADGHHRFAAAREHQVRGGHDDEAVLALLTPMGPGGLRLQAIHRVLPDLRLDDATAAAARGFTVTELPLDGGLRPAVGRWVDGAERPAFLLTDGTRVVQLTAPAPELWATVPAEAPPAWRRLDVVLAHHGLFGSLLGRPDDPASVLVAHDVDEALRLAAERAGVAVLLRSPSPADVAAVARAGARMPRKSTLFVPKPRTGLVLRPHDEQPGHGG